MAESSGKTAPPGVSRRNFLKGSGAAAATVAMVSLPASAKEAPRAANVIRGKTKITLSVNGKKHKVEVEPRTTLLEVLRYQLDLTGAKPASIDGSSGASTILIDGRPVMASTTLALAARGKAIQTVESLSRGKTDEVINAFVDQDAEQCGFCTPGFVVAVRSFLDKNPKASEQEIRQGLNGNICRCGTYANIIQAAISIAKGGK